MGINGTAAPKAKANKLDMEAFHGDPKSSGLRPNSSFAIVSRALAGFDITAEATFLASSSSNPLALYIRTNSSSSSSGHSSSSARSVSI